MTPLEKARQAVVEAEEELREEWPKEAPRMIRQLQDSRGRDWVMPSRGVCESSWVDAADTLVIAWRNLRLIEERELDAHRQRVLANNAKVSGQAASSAA